MNYFQAGYFLVKLNEEYFGTVSTRKLCTASTCINDSFLDTWAFSWVVDTDRAALAQELEISQDKITDLQNWAELNMEENKIGWPNVFYALDALIDFKNTFFQSRKDLVSLGLFFSETEARDLMDEFEPITKQDGEIGLSHALRQKVPENQDGEFIGYDLIGIEMSGDFHTIHCHGLEEEFAHKFGIEFLDNGLIKSCDDWESLTDYCNDPSNGLEPVPWFYCKVKKYD